MDIYTTTKKQINIYGHNNLRLFSILLPSLLLILIFSTFQDYNADALQIGNPDGSNKNPFAVGEDLQIVMIYENKEYTGQLQSSVWQSGDTDGNMPATEKPLSNGNETAILENQTVDIKKGSEVKFVVKGIQKPEVQPDSLAVSAYDTDGNAVKVLNLSQDKKDTFTVDLNNGEYILIATATWVPNEDNYLTTEGYITYAFRIISHNG